MPECNAKLHGYGEPRDSRHLEKQDDIKVSRLVNLKLENVMEAHSSKLPLCYLNISNHSLSILSVDITATGDN